MQIESNRKYAKWKAAYIHNCLKNGETPISGPLPDEDEDLAGATGGSAPGRTLVVCCSIPTVLWWVCLFVYLSVCLLRHVHIAESEPYCHSILFVCLSVIPQPTAYHDWSITTKFGRQIYTCPRTHVSLFGSPVSHTLGARGKNMQNFAYFQRVFLPLRTWCIMPYDLSVCLTKCSVHDACGHGLVLFWQHCDMLRSSSFVDDVMLNVMAKNWPMDQEVCDTQSQS